MHSVEEGFSEARFGYAIVREVEGEAPRIVATFKALAEAQAELDSVRKRFWREGARFYVCEE